MNQINLIIYTTKFETFLFHQIFLRNRTCDWWYHENCPPVNYPQQKLPRPPEKLPFENTLSLINIPPMKAHNCENYPSEIRPRENCLLWKFSYWENYPPWNPLPIYKSYKWKKQQKHKKFSLQKAVQHHIVIKTVKVFLDIDMVSQKILALDTFFTE